MKYTVKRTAVLACAALMIGSPMAWTFGVLAARETLPIIKAAQANTAVLFTVYFIFYTSFTIKKN